MSNVHYESNKISQTANEIRRISEEYRKAGYAFKNEIINACSDWDGISKEAFIYLIKGSVEDQLCNRIPEIVRAVAELMLEISETFERLDYDISEKIIHREGNN